MEQRRALRRPTGSFSLASGSSGNSTYIANKQTALLVDIGINCKGICRSLDTHGVDPAELDGILITHEHSDHVSGLDVFARRYKTPIYINEATWQRVRLRLKYADQMDVRIIESESRFQVGDIAVKSFRTPHDAVESLGYRLDTGEGTVSVFTDLGHASDRLIAEISGSDLVYIEANYDPQMLHSGPYPWPLKERISGDYGHLANPDCAEAMLKLLESGTTQFILSHLSEQNNYPELAELTVCRILDAAGAKVGLDYQMTVAPRFAAGDLIGL